MESSPPQLAYEKLDVYKCALEFLAIAVDCAAQLPLASSLKDQLSRAALSITLNIAEGAGRARGTADARRFYNIARGSAMECGAIFDALLMLKLIPQAQHIQGKTLLVRIVQMLSKMTG